MARLCLSKHAVTHTLKVSASCLFLLFSSTTLAADKITLGFYADPKTSAQSKFFELLYREAFTRLDYEFEYRVMPMKRISITANRGEIDGEPQRNGDYAQTYQNLIRVEEPVFITNVYAFATNNQIDIQNWDSFSHEPYYVDYMIGALQTEQALGERIPTHYLTGINSVEQGLARLKEGRTHVFVDLEVRTAPFLKSLEFKDSNIQVIATLSSHKSYPYLHKRHQKLAGPLAQVIRDLKAEGVYKKLLQQTLPFIDIQAQKSVLLAK